MKKIIVMLVLALTSIGGYASVNGEINNQDIPIKVRLVLDFGKKSLGCAEFGICIKEFSLDWGFGSSLKEGGYVGGLSNENGHVELSFVRQDLSSSVIKKYFSGDKFVFGEDVILESSYLKKINLPQKYTIKAGTYPVKRTETSYIIVLE